MSNGRARRTQRTGDTGSAGPSATGQAWPRWSGLWPTALAAAVVLGLLLVIGWHLPPLPLVILVVVAFVVLWLANRRVARKMNEDHQPKVPGWRILLSGVLGLAVALAGTLWILDADIDADRRAGVSAGVGPRPDLQRLETEERHLLGKIATPVPSVEQIPAVARLRMQLDTTFNDLRAAEVAILCEEDGTCGTGVVGRGPRYRSKVMRRDQLLRDKMVLETDLGSATMDSNKSIKELSEERMADELALSTVQSELESRKAVAAQADGFDLVQRLIVMYNVSTRRPVEAFIAFVVAGVIFMALDLVPLYLGARLRALRPPRIGDVLDGQAVQDQRRVDEEQKKADEYEERKKADKLAEEKRRTAEPWGQYEQS